MNVKELKNKSWRLFVTRPATLLERTLRCPGYHRAGLTHIIVTSHHGLCRIYIDDREWKRLEKQAVLFFERKGRRRLDAFTKLLETHKRFLKKIRSTDSVSLLATCKSLFSLYGRMTEAIIYTHLLEKQVDDRKSLRRYRGTVGYLHEHARRSIDELYEAFIHERETAAIEWHLPTEFLKGKAVNKKLIQLRKIFYFLSSKNNKIQIWTGDVAHKLISTLERSQRDHHFVEKVSEVTGTVACRGVVRGRATVIDDLRKLSTRTKKVEIIASWVQKLEHKF